METVYDSARQIVVYFNIEPAIRVKMAAGLDAHPVPPCAALAVINNSDFCLEILVP
jgi:hypothetical protein